jgi:hypothetical protein
MRSGDAPAFGSVRAAIPAAEGARFTIAPRSSTSHGLGRHSCAGLWTDNDGRTPVPGPATPVGEGVK